MRCLHSAVHTQWQSVENGHGPRKRYMSSEMQKVADAADISVLFFQLVLIFGPFWVIFWPFWQFWVVFGPIWVILGHFWAIFCANFLWQNIALCYLNDFL